MTDQRLPLLTRGEQLGEHGALLQGWRRGAGGRHRQLRAKHLRRRWRVSPGQVTQRHRLLGYRPGARVVLGAALRRRHAARPDAVLGLGAASRENRDRRNAVRSRSERTACFQSHVRRKKDDDITVNDEHRCQERTHLLSPFLPHGQRAGSPTLPQFVCSTSCHTLQACAFSLLLLSKSTEVVVLCMM